MELISPMKRPPPLAISSGISATLPCTLSCQLCTLSDLLRVFRVSGRERGRKGGVREGGEGGVR
eukprot:445691-Rhodomonas_salina.1